MEGQREPPALAGTAEGGSRAGSEVVLGCGYSHACVPSDSRWMSLSLLKHFLKDGPWNVISKGWDVGEPMCEVRWLN